MSASKESKMIYTKRPVTSDFGPRSFRTGDFGRLLVIWDGDFGRCAVNSNDTVNSEDDFGVR